VKDTFITVLAMSGERIKVVQELARNSKADLTLNVYSAGKSLIDRSVHFVIAEPY
jgi:hypothetical protein